ncbi:MAG: glycosyltransferase family 4 protein [Candidatus Omnitrophica bacterium]|nr:glycosyltransferase family 4 protein [Candidatus Omnitrophota bacterium]
MRIAINCRSFLKKQYTGIGRYSYHLVKSLSEIDGKNEYQLYARKGVFSFNKKTPRFPAKNFTSRVDWFGRGIAKQLKNIDLCHFPSPGPLEAPDGAKIIVTVHDVIFKAFPQGHTLVTIDAGERQFEQIRKQSAKIICCSDNTACDLKKYFQVPDEKIVRIYPGVDKGIFNRIAKEEEATAERVLAQKGVKQPFILSVGTIEPRKNLINSIHAFHALRAKKDFSGKLVVIGMDGWLHDDLVNLIETLRLKKDIIFLGYLTDAELRYFYNKAEVFIFPSFYEGFGFPILEAFCCGAPVVTSNISSCPEIAGDAALSVDPNSPQDIAGAIGRIVSDRDLRETLREKGSKRAEDFDFRKTAEETLKVYEEVYGL